MLVVPRDESVGQTQNRISDLLVALGLCDPSAIKILHPRVRDRDDIQVLRCSKSGVIFLSRSDHIDRSTYEARDGFEYWSAENPEDALVRGREDDLRRFEQFKNRLSGMKWVDIGTGAGGVLDLGASVTPYVTAVEPQRAPRESLSKRGYTVYRDVESLPDRHFEVATLFHVLEHLAEPIRTLERISVKMREGGTLIVEVPHANDFLISFLDLEAFKAFTFWSEHLILHTKQSLRTFLEASGFTNVVVSGFQRYPLANHLYWTRRGLPAGHLAWSSLRSPDLDDAYSRMLARLDMTDTLIATAEKGKH